MTRSAMTPNPNTLFDVETWFEDDDHSVALVVLNGVGRRVKNNLSDVTYEVVSGQGTFVVNEDERLDICVHTEPGMALTIKKGYAYQDSGDMVMLAKSVPPFDPKYVEILD